MNAGERASEQARACEGMRVHESFNRWPNRKCLWNGPHSFDQPALEITNLRIGMNEPSSSMNSIVSKILFWCLLLASSRSYVSVNNNHRSCRLIRIRLIPLTRMNFDRAILTSEFCSLKFRNKVFSLEPSINPATDQTERKGIDWWSRFLKAAISSYKYSGLNT